MVVIRLQRRGTKKAPHHRIVATDKQTAQRGRVLETLGYYDPSYEPPKFSLDESRLVHWVSAGARVSPAVGHLVKRFKKS
jgi:small subunit ribosomal protein S16